MSPRALKPQRVETLFDNAKALRIEVFFDREEKDFFGKVGEKVVRGDSVDACRNGIYIALKDYNPFVWERCIEATVEEPPDWGRNQYIPKHAAQASFSFRRFEMAKTNAKDGNDAPIALERPFVEDLNVEQRKRLKERPDCYNSKRFARYGREDDLLVPYSDELWDRLTNLAEVVNGAQAKLHELLAPETKGAKLLTLKKGGLFLVSGGGK